MIPFPWLDPICSVFSKLSCSFIVTKGRCFIGQNSSHYPRVLSWYCICYPARFCLPYYIVSHLCIINFQVLIKFEIKIFKSYNKTDLTDEDCWVEPEDTFSEVERSWPLISFISFIERFESVNFNKQLTFSSNMEELRNNIFYWPLFGVTLTLNIPSRHGIRCIYFLYFLIYYFRSFYYS